MAKDKSKYYWQGEEVKVTFGFSFVNENKEKPLWWHNYECATDFVDPASKSAMIRSIRVQTKNGSDFVISNHFGIGVHKLKNGGWPNICHFSLPDNNFEASRAGKITEFNRGMFEEHENARNQWQKKNFPNEYEKKQSFLRSAFKHLITKQWKPN